MERPPVGRAAARRITIDPDLCIGSGECVRLQPEAFRLDERAGVTEALPAADELSPLERRLVVESCPMGAIALRTTGPGS